MRHTGPNLADGIFLLTENEHPLDHEVFIMKSGYGAFVFPGELARSADDLEGPVHLRRLRRRRVLEVQTTLQNAQVLRKDRERRCVFVNGLEWVANTHTHRYTTGGKCSGLRREGHFTIWEL